jgi:hypothetical protein
MATKYFVAQGSQLYIMNPTVSPHVAVVAAQLQGLDGIGGQKSSIKLSNFDSPGYDEYAPGLVDPGKPSGNCVLDMLNTAHQLLQTLLGLGQNAQTSFFYGLADGTSPPTVVTGVLTPPSTGSPKVYTRSGWLWDGFVNEWTVSAATNNVAMAKFGCQATGARQMIVKGLSAPV